jgi:hypothetical protein
MPQHGTEPWKPFRPTNKDLETLAKDVAEVRDLQTRLVDRHGDLQQADRVAHQYQIAGSKVILKIADELPAELLGVGLFQPKAEHTGIGRISTGLGCPHAESNPDFLGLMLAFRAKDGQRVDFLALNDPTSPADDHHEFMDILDATVASAGADSFIAEQSEFANGLRKRRGLLKGGKTLAHVIRQTIGTKLSSSAYQTYWTGIVETGPTAAKFILVPVRDESRHPGLSPGPGHLTEEWRARQAKGDVELHLFWLPFSSEKETPTIQLTDQWKEERRVQVGTVIFPKADFASEEARLWAVLAAEMGANQGNWVHNQEDSIHEPATEFGAARKIAYRISQAGREALDPKTYESVFATGRIGPELEQELTRRREKREKAGHVSMAPV